MIMTCGGEGDWRKWNACWHVFFSHQICKLEEWLEKKGVKLMCISNTACVASDVTPRKVDQLSE